jgi:hypothetical protein
MKRVISTKKLLNNLTVINVKDSSLIGMLKEYALTVKEKEQEEITVKLAGGI